MSIRHLWGIVDVLERNVNNASVHMHIIDVSDFVRFFCCEGTMLYQVAMVLQPRTHIDVHADAYLPIIADDSDLKWKNAWITHNPWGYLFDCVNDLYPHVVDRGTGWTFAGFVVLDANTFVATYIGKQFQRKTCLSGVKGKPAWSMLEIEGRRVRVAELTRFN